MIKAIYKTGSSLLLNNYRDIDYIYYYENDYEKVSDRHKDIHYVPIDKAKRIFLGCYIYSLMEHVWGIDLGFDTFNLFDHEKEYHALLKKYVGWLKTNDKNWYHVLVGVYMLENRKIELTKEQLANVQKVHDDRCISEKLYTYIIEKLK